jgi:hypothetical protein
MVKLNAPSAVVCKELLGDVALIETYQPGASSGGAEGSENF